MVLWGCYYAAIGLLYPVWMDYMAKILDPSKRGRALGIVFLTQTVAGAAGATAAAALLRGGTSDGRYAVLFFVAAAAMSGGPSSSWARESDLREHRGRLRSPALPRPRGLWRRHRWLEAYLWARWMVRGTYPLLVHFFAVYAVAYKGFSRLPRRSWARAHCCARRWRGVAAGALGDRAGHKVSVLLGQGLLLASCTLAVLPVPGWAFLSSRASRERSWPPNTRNQAAWLMDLASDTERQSVLALVGFLLTPASVLTAGRRMAHGSRGVPARGDGRGDHRGGGHGACGLHLARERSRSRGSEEVRK